MKKKKVYCENCKNLISAYNIFKKLLVLTIPAMMISLILFVLSACSPYFPYDRGFLLLTIIIAFITGMFSFIVLTVPYYTCQKAITEYREEDTPLMKEYEEIIFDYDTLNKNNDCRYYEEK